LSFKAPQGRHDEPIGDKFGVEDSTEKQRQILPNRC